MDGVIPGLGGCANCQNCAAPNPCAGAAPVLSTCAGRNGFVGTSGTWSAFSTGQWTNGATWSATGLPPGLSINTSAGFISGTPNAAGAYSVTSTAANGCGSSSCTFTFQVDTDYCRLTLDTAGGDAGYDNTFDVTGDFTTARNIYVDFESYTVKDQLLIYANGSLVYDSGCIGARVMPTVAMPAGTTNSRVVVVANCEGTTDTLWVLGITCA